MSLVAELLRDSGHSVEVFGYGGSQLTNRLREAGLWAKRGLRGRVDVQIFLERVYRRCLDSAHRNVLVPNPEWFSAKWMPLLPRFDRVLCKTRHAMDAFSALGCDVRYSGFTSEDIHVPNVPRLRRFFHLAGRSSAKGTQTLIEAWTRHPEWPRLTIVQHPKLVKERCVAANVDHIVDYVDAAALRRMQNSHMFHLCPSETEGFGHYLFEGMAAGAVVLATDGAPMNEFVTTSTGVLLRAGSVERRGLADHYFVDIAGIEDGVERALAMDGATCVEMGNAARQRFVELDRAFRQGFADACLAP
ncbi:MAG: glycosyltransferase [Luteimonas sp.]